MTATTNYTTDVLTLQEQLCEALDVAGGQIIRVMCTSRDNNRVSYRICMLLEGRTREVARLISEFQTTRINDILWQLTYAKPKWICRPIPHGAGFLVYHPIYTNYILNCEETV